MKYNLPVRAVSLSIIAILAAVLLFADDRTVDFDRHLDFSTLKTFALREGKVDSPSPELNNSLLSKRIGDAIRSELIAKGLKETVNNPDVIVDYSISGENFSEQRGGPISSSEGTLVIDLTKRDSRALVWRSVYRDSERNSAKLAQKLPGDVKKSFSDYPPKQKGVIQPGPAGSATSPASATPGTAAGKLNPKAAASAALDIIQSTRQATDFVGPNTHPGLSISLTQLERTARALADDDGRNAAAATNKGLAFYEAMKETADYAASIADRRVETADSRARARDLAARLRALSSD
jgi:hypothetical protein